jgi:hypothetical protein
VKIRNAAVAVATVAVVAACGSSGSKNGDVKLCNAYQAEVNSGSAVAGLVPSLTTMANQASDAQLRTDAQAFATSINGGGFLDAGAQAAIISDCQRAGANMG